MEKLSFELEPDNFLYRRATLKYEENGVKHEKEFVFFDNPRCMEHKITHYLKKNNCLINLNLGGNKW